MFTDYLSRSQVEIEIKKRMKAEATQDHLVRTKIDQSLEKVTGQSLKN